jgi:hypothetical protein
MIFHSSFNGVRAAEQRQDPRSFGWQILRDALAEIVHVLTITYAHYGAWIEDIDDTAVKIGSYGMAGERIHIYEGSTDEIMQLAAVCRWFYRDTGCASDEFKAKMLREEHARGFTPHISTSSTYRPTHGGRHPDCPVAFAA